MNGSDWVWFQTQKPRPSGRGSSSSDS